jgi:hypothetical protein
VSNKNSDRREDLRLSASELEAMTPGDLADLLSNIVLVIRRMPQNIPVSQLKPVEDNQEERDLPSD